MKNNTAGRNIRAQLARVSVGRMFLHIACVLRDGRVQWHWEGIKREFTSKKMPPASAKIPQPFAF